MIKKLFKRKRSAIKHEIYWNNCDIPAKLFYNEVVAKSNLSVLGNAPMPELKKAFSDIIDELFEIENNNDLREALKKREKVSYLYSVIATIEAVLHAIVYLYQTHEEREKQIALLNTIEYVKIRFKTGLTDENDILDEVKRVQNVVIGSLKNKIHETKGEEKESTEKTTATFERDLVSISMLMEFTLPDNISLRMFAEYKKAAQERIKAMKKHKNGK